MPRKDYSSEVLVVHWDSRRCIHTGICIRTLPQVFDVHRRPWITADAAAVDEVVAAVVKCPTGALRYSRRDGGAAEEAGETTTVVPIPNGPLFLRGPIRVTAPDGTVLADETRVALCRCGASGNPPFCDNSHRALGFRTSDAAPAPAQTAPTPASPAEVCEPQEFFR